MALLVRNIINLYTRTLTYLPRVGKTSTAECIALHIKKSLYSLISGNHGVEPDEVEENLQKHFDLAAKWDCILLLDEADVLLQQRHQNQLNINAIVSVFLRQLEYYTGILFLTTNRVGDIDRAFKSRIHVTLEYKPLDRDTFLEIYRLRIKRIRAEYATRNRKLKVKEDKIMEWAKQQHRKSKAERRQWNGRQIFNAFQTAIALAEWSNTDANSNTESTKKQKKFTLGQEQFKQVAKVSAGFEQYMTELLGYDEHFEAAMNATRRYLHEDVAPHRNAVRWGHAAPTPASKAARDDSEDSDTESEEDYGSTEDDSDDEGDRRERKRRMETNVENAASSSRNSSSSDDGEDGK